MNLFQTEIGSVQVRKIFVIGLLRCKDDEQGGNLPFDGVARHRSVQTTKSSKSSMDTTREEESFCHVGSFWSDHGEQGQWFICSCFWEVIIFLLGHSNFFLGDIWICFCWLCFIFYCKWSIGFAPRSCLTGTAALPQYRGPAWEGWTGGPSRDELWCFQKTGDWWGYCEYDHHRLSAA